MGIKTRHLPCSLALLAVFLATCAAFCPYAYGPFGEQGREHCYQLVVTKMTWGKAWDFCRNDESYLGIINSDQEANFYKNLFSPYPSEPEIFVGIDDCYLEETWITIHGETLEQAGFARWDLGEPNNLNGNENCGTMRHDGLLNDLNCDATLMFICEAMPDYGTDVVISDGIHVRL